MGVIEEQVFSKIYDIVLDIGLTAFQERFKSASDRKKIKNKLEDYLSRKLKENRFCSREEEIDFEGLAEYIRQDLIEDIETRLFGNEEERNYARLQILSKSTAYSQAHTKLAKDRVQRMVTSLMDLLTDFYREKIPKELRMMSGEIVDTLKKDQQEQTEILTKTISAARDTLTKRIQQDNILSTDRNIQLLQDGDYQAVERNVTSAIRAIGAQHPLNQFYQIRFRSVNGRDEAFSCPISTDIPKEYLPRMELKVKATLDGKNISRFDSSNLGYSFRHQIPFEVNVVAARKLLGNIMDPYQHEAEREVGKHYKIYPPKFPAAFSCTLLGDDKPIIEYLLLRTHEILDDGTYIVTNQEQKGAPYKFEFEFNECKKTFHFRINPWNHKNSEHLLIAKIVSVMDHSTIIKLRSLEHATDLISGQMQRNTCKPIFDTFSEDIAFFEKIIDIEKYFGREISLPNSIGQDDLLQIDYISSLIRGEKCEGSWSEFTTDFIVTKKLKESIDAVDQAHEFCFMASGTVSITLSEQSYELPIKRTFPYVAIKNQDHVRKKIQVLDVGDPIKITYIPGKSGNTMWDQLDSQEAANQLPR